MAMILLFLLAIFMPSATVRNIPSSERSQQSIERVKPALSKALNEKGLQYGSPILIRIFKESSELEVWVKGDQQFELFRTYKICRYSGELGPKQQEGDLQSPEGFYKVKPDQLNPNSRFHLSFNVGYPNTFDRSYGRTGSAIMVHGNCVSIGCFAMTDEKIEEIYALADGALRNGQLYFWVHLFPFRMSESNIEAHKDSQWLGFWRNLKPIYDYFETNKQPPRVVVRRGRYLLAKSKKRTVQR